MDSPRRRRHISGTIGKKPKRAKEGNNLARTLARWENAGGAVKPGAMKDCDKPVVLAEV